MPSQPPSQPTIRAAYGLRFAGVDGVRTLAAANGAPWPELRIERRVAPADTVARGFGGRRACFSLPQGRLLLERARQTITTVTPQPLPDDALVHPHLTVASAMWARWLGRDAFHGGAVAIGGGAWALLAQKEGGKSTLLGQLAGLGHAVVADDMLILDGGHVYAGPRCVDLRPDAADALERSEVELVRDASRRRVPLRDVPLRVPLRGLVHLEWGERVEVRSVPVSERIDRLRAHNNFVGIPARPATLLELAALPHLELRRPRGLDSLQASAEALCAAIA
jgi:hypothetical protein